MINALSNPTLPEVDYLMFNGNMPENREPHTGVFTGCMGELDVGYFGCGVNVRFIEDLVLQEFEANSIGFATWQEFVINFRNTWNRNIYPLFELLNNQVDFTLADSTEDVQEKTTGTVDAVGQNTGSQKFSDTPNQYLSEPNPNQFLSTYTAAENNTSGHQQGEGTRELKTLKTGNQYERWLELSDKTRNIIYSFINKFYPLFQTTYVLRRY